MGVNMKKALIVLTLMLATATPAIAGAPRTLNATLPADGLDTVKLEAGVGDVEIFAADTVDEVTLEVQLKPRRGGFFSSMKKAQREVDEAELRVEASGGTLRLEIDTDADDRHFEESWTIELPSRLAFDLELGVGDVEIRGIAGELSCEIGVGDVLVEAVSGDVTVEVGVGDASVTSSADFYGSVAGSGGVGDAKLTVRGERISSSGFVGHSAEWNGEGPHHIEISVGVGDARVTLE
jgi:hypothetical protein